VEVSKLKIELSAILQDRNFLFHRSGNGISELRQFSVSPATHWRAAFVLHLSQAKFIYIFLYFGYLLEPVIRIWYLIIFLIYLLGYIL
jgi:hypothetical protein